MPIKTISFSLSRTIPNTSKQFANDKPELAVTIELAQGENPEQVKSWLVSYVTNSMNQIADTIEKTNAMNADMNNRARHTIDPTKAYHSGLPAISQQQAQPNEARFQSGPALSHPPLSPQGQVASFQQPPAPQPSAYTAPAPTDQAPSYDMGSDLPPLPAFLRADDVIV